MFSDSVRPAFLGLIGLSAGGIIAAGVFAFLAIIGVFPRLIGKTGTHRHILLYETIIVLGGSRGNIAELYNFPIPWAESCSMQSLACLQECLSAAWSCLWQRH